MKSYYRVVLAILLLPVVFISNNLIALMIAKLFDITGGLWFFVAITLTQTILMIGFTLYLAIGRWKLAFNDLGFDWSKWAAGLRQGLFYGPLVFLLVSLGGALVQLFHPLTDEIQPFAKIVLEAGSATEITVLCLFAVVLAPVAEELYFRGLLFGVLKDQVGLKGGILFSGLFFGLMHFDLLRLLPLAIGGMTLAWLYQKTGSLYASITAHGVWNGLMLIILLLSETG
ncbi:MAG: CPBP family intramembrane metalloprotease [Clostridia bacterium]|jgi:membrane protease YdiL (CAAX protease family)|nr:CPBP family intramembrane metalloprotease [Clostridia bacterium]